MSAFAAAGASAMAAEPAEQTTPVVASVIASPEPVLTSNGRNQLAYELQLINRSESTVTVRKVEALAGGRVVEKLAGKSLEAVMQPYGQPTRTAKLGPGEAGFVLMDVSLARKAKVPAELSHRIVISMQPKKAGVGLAYSLAPVKVTRRKAIVIDPPLYGPNWLIGSGCCSNYNYHRSVVWPVNGKIAVAERFAIDFAQLDSANRYLDGPVDQFSSYPAYGAEVHSVAAGRVVSVTDDIPDTPAGTVPRSGRTLEEVGGNQVFIAIGHDRYAYYAHLVPGSITVHPGERVQAGQTIGLLGNSGNSTAAHLHFQVVGGPLSLGSNGMPYRFAEFNVVGSVAAELPEHGVAIDRGEAGIRHDELPMDEQVVAFPEGLTPIPRRGAPGGEPGA